MALICDTGAIFAAYDADDVHHAAAKAALEAEPGPLFLPTVLLAEIDYLLTSRLSTNASLDFLDSILEGAFTLVAPSSDDLVRCRELITTYRDLSLGLADATVVAAAERLQIPRVFTVDRRHFRAIQPRGFTHLTLVPADR